MSLKPYKIISLPMKITVQNNTNVSNKYVRKLKWYLYQLAEKFNHLIYAIIHIKQEGSAIPVYEVSVQIGMPGPDVIIKNKSSNIEELVQRSYKDAFRYCRKTKPSGWN